jgi:hypothetical protein
VTYSSNLPADDLAQHENDVDSHRITFRSGYTWNIEGFEEVSVLEIKFFNFRIPHCSTFFHALPAYLFSARNPAVEALPIK